MAEAKSVTATFTLEQYELTVTLAGNGAGTVTSAPVGIDCATDGASDCAEVLDYGTVITLTAVADAGSTFTGWNGACTGTEDCVVTITEAVAVTATFTQYKFYMPLLLFKP
jgi:hypothetical protein